MNFYEFCRRAGFLPNDYAKSKWAQWQSLSNIFAAFDDETLEKILGSPTLTPIFIIFDGASTDRLMFETVEFEDGTIVPNLPALTPYFDRPELYRLGPFLASVREPGLEAVPGASSPSVQSSRKDGPSGSGTPGALAGYGRFDDSNITHQPDEGEAHSVDECETRGCVKLKLAPLPKSYKGPINVPCSSCSDGDTAMEFHTHDWVPVKERRHQLLTVNIEEEADAKCTCGEWRLLRVATTRVEMELQRREDIEREFRKHLDLVGVSSTRIVSE
jgi:hypothetical protein